MKNLLPKKRYSTTFGVDPNLLPKKRYSTTFGVDPKFIQKNCELSELAV